MNTHNNAVQIVTGSGDQDDRKMRGAALRDVMEAALSARQMSVSGLARDANVQRGDIYRWWRGDSRPTRNSLARIAAALTMDVDPLREALGDSPRATETPDAVLGAIAVLSDRLGRLEASQRVGFETVLEAIAASVGGAPSGTSSDSEPASPARTRP